MERIDVKVEYHVQTRRRNFQCADSDRIEYTPWRIVHDADTPEESCREYDDHLNGGYRPECVRIIKRIILDEVIQ